MALSFIDRRGDEGIMVGYDGTDELKEVILETKEKTPLAKDIASIKTSPKWSDPQ